MQATQDEEGQGKEGPIVLSPLSSRSNHAHGGTHRGLHTKKPVSTPKGPSFFQEEARKGNGREGDEKVESRGREKRREGGRSEENQTGDGGFGSHYHSKVVAWHRIVA